MLHLCIVDKGGKVHGLRTNFHILYVSVESFNLSHFAVLIKLQCNCAVTEPVAEGVGRKNISHVPSYVTCFIFTIIFNQEENTSARLQKNSRCPQK